MIPSSCVVTGQQLGFMGGPLFTFFKALTCIKTAQELGSEAIFWAATEDHDIAEINHSYLLDAHGNLAKYQLKWPSRGIAVENLTILPKHIDVFEAFWKASSLSFDLPQVGMRYADAMLQILAQAFAGTGLRFLEPRSLRHLAVPLFQEEIRRCDSLSVVLRETTAKLAALGQPTPLQISDGPNLFYNDARNHRTKIHRIENGFRIGKDAISEDDLLKKIENETERFSPSAALRPIIQSALLPVQVYVGGPTEIQYHAQLVDYFKAFGVTMPKLMPRISGTLITPMARKYLDALELKPSDPLTWGEHKGRANIPDHALHYLNNFLHPHGKLQERVLNWWAMHDTNLMQKLFKALDWNEQRHQYIDI